MADEQDVSVRFKAQIKDYLDKMGQAAHGTQEATTKINEHLETVGKGYEKLMGTLGALTAVLAGGKMFKEAVDATLQWNWEAVKLSKTLGVTTEQASVLRLALGDIYTDTETYTRAVQMMTRQINGGGEGMKRLGIETRDANGHLRPSTELMQEALDKLNELKAGTDRNAAGMAIFGRSWGEASKLLMLNSEVMEEARQKAERLHLVVGPEGVAMTKAYKAAMNDVEDVLESLKVQVGSAILPVLIKLGAFMGEHGPAMAEGLSYAIKGVIQVFYLLKAIVETITIALTALISTMIEGWKTVGDVVSNVVTGNFKGAAQAAIAGARAIKNEWEAAAEGIATSWKNFSKDSGSLWSNDKKPASKAIEGDTLGEDDAGKKDKKTLFQQLEEELQRRKAVYTEWTNGLEMTKQGELKFWQDSLANMKKGTEDWTKGRLKQLELEKAIQKEEEADEKKAQKEREDLAKVDRQWQEADAKFGLELKREALAQEVALGKVTKKQEIADLKFYRQEEYEIEKAALDKELKAVGDNEVKKAEIRLKAHQAALRLQQDMAKFDTQFSVEQKKATDAAAKQWQQWAQVAGNAIGDVMGGLVRHSMTAQQALQTLAQAALKIMLDYVMKTVTAKAAEAGAGAAASAAQTPVIGWTLAIPAMAAVMGAVLGLQGSISSAAQGFDIPSGLNPMTQLHEREMVLPAEHADTIRGLKGGAGGPMQVTIHAVDSKSVERLFRQNPQAVARSISDLHRNGRLGRL